MTDKEVPSVDSNFEGSPSSKDAREFGSLTSEAKLTRLLEKEVGQRYWIRSLAVFVGITVIIFMGFLLFHLTNKILFGPFLFVHPAFSVVIITAPILSITTIVGALFVGGFRKSDGTGENPMVDGIAEGISKTLPSSK